MKSDDTNMKIPIYTNIFHVKKKKYDDTNATSFQINLRLRCENTLYFLSTVSKKIYLHVHFDAKLS